MHINELLSENQIDELSLGDVGKGIEKGVGGLAKGIGYVAGIPGGIAQKFQQGKARATAGIGGTMAQQPAQVKQPNPKFTQALQNYQQFGTATAPAGDAKAIKNQITQKQKELTALQAQLKTASTPPATTPTPAVTTPPQATPAAATAAYDPAKAAADKAAKVQADAAQRNADIEKTKQANAAAAASAAEQAKLKAAADAAKAKPAFNQTAADKLAIKAAAEKGINEGKENKFKKKTVAEFNSRFLKMKI